MTTEDFNKKLAAAKTIEELKELRGKTGASAFVSRIKAKIDALPGWEEFRMTTTALKALVNVNKSDTNCLSKITVPATSRTLKKYAGQKVMVYVQSKENTGSTAVILVKNA